MKLVHYQIIYQQHILCSKNNFLNILSILKAWNYFSPYQLRKSRKLNFHVIVSYYYKFLSASINTWVWGVKKTPKFHTYLIACVAFELTPTKQASSSYEKSARVFYNFHSFHLFLNVLWYYSWIKTFVWFEKFKLSCKELNVTLAIVNVQHCASIYLTSIIHTRFVTKSQKGDFNLWVL